MVQPYLKEAREEENKMRQKKDNQGA
jgi:hypothetical protein